MRQLHNATSLAIVYVLITSAAVAGAGLSFVGKWDCGVSIFTFTKKTYHNGFETLPIQTITKRESDYHLKFKDGYAISLFDVGAETMTWHSLASGDIFECKRIK